MNTKGKKYKELAANTAIFTISSFGSKLLSFFLVPLYTFYLSTEDYGTADIIGTTASLLIFVLTIDISDSVLRFAIERDKDQEKILSFGLKVQFSGAFVLGIVLFLLQFLNVIKWEKYCYLFLLLIFILNAVHQAVTNYLRAINKIKEVAVSGVLQTLATILLNIFCLAFLKLGLIGYLISGVAGFAISVLYCFMKTDVSFSELVFAKCEKTIKKEMVMYSIPLIFNGIAWWMNSSLDKYFITSIIGIGASGIYAVSYKIPSILTMFNQIFAQAWNLSAIKEFDKDDKDGFFSRTYTIYNAGMVLSCSLIIIMNIVLAKFLYAKDFYEAWKYTSPLLISIIFSALSSFVGSIFSAVKNSRIFAISTVSAAAVNTLLNAVLIPVIGIQGAAVATAVSFMAIWLIRLVSARKYINMKLNIKRDVFAYSLLAVQAVIEHFKDHYYVFQLLIFSTLVFIYFKEIKIITGKLYSVSFKRMIQKKNAKK